MTEPIDQATKDLIEKEAKEKYVLISNQEIYIAGATVWAEKLKQLETQSHDQVRIIEHLEGQLKQERNKVIDDAIGKIKALMGDKSDIEVRIGLIHSLKILESIKDKSHE